MKNRVLAALGLGAACAACCAPLLAPLLFGAGTAGLGVSFSLSQMGLGVDEIVCGGLAAAFIAGGAYWFWRTQRKAKAAKQCECIAACDPQTCAPAKIT